MAGPGSGIECAVREIQRLAEFAQPVQPANEAALRSALGAMLTSQGMDEDGWNKPTFDQARAALLQPAGEIEPDWKTMYLQATAQTARAEDRAEEAEAKAAQPVQPADWGCLTGHPAIEAQIARQVSAAEPVAWLIESPKEGTLYRAVYLHNAIGDFRGANPNATSTPLYAAQTETESDKVADLTNRLQDAYQSIGNLERNIAALETIIVRSLFYPTDAKEKS